MRKPTAAEMERERAALVTFKKTIAHLSKDELYQNTLALFGQLRDVYWKLEATREEKRPSRLGMAVAIGTKAFLAAELLSFTPRQRNKLRKALRPTAAKDRASTRGARR